MLLDRTSLDKVKNHEQVARPDRSPLKQSQNKVIKPKCESYWIHPNSTVLISVFILTSLKEIPSNSSEEFCIQRCIKKSSSTIKITHTLKRMGVGTNHLLPAFLS